MLHLIENYYAIPNNMGFTLAHDKGRTDNEGNPIYVPWVIAETLKRSFYSLSVKL